MNKETYLYEWIGHSTRSHDLIWKWNGPGTFIKAEWVKKKQKDEQTR